jgi:uncharacterized iron-regulated protein
MKSFRWICLLLFVSWVGFGCAKKIPLPLWASQISMIPEPIGSERILKVSDGGWISFAQLMEDLREARVIYAGETHDQMEHHQIQLRILQGLVEKGKEVVVAMEMFQRSQQPVLDRWSLGELTEEEFLKEVDWETMWSMDYSLYRGILDEAKKKGLKVLGLNIPREWVKKIAQNGIEGLSPEDRGKLPEIDLTDQQHRTYIQSIYGQHHQGLAKTFEYFYQSQCLWDEGMAETLSRFLESPEGKGKTILVLAGGGHVVFDFGIPKRVYRRVSVPYQTIVLRERKKKLDEDLTFAGAAYPPGNFLWITPPAPPEKKRPRIGVTLKIEEVPQGIAIERVIPESPAEKAGLLPGDQFIAVEGKEIKGVKDIHAALDEKGWGKEITFTILRDGLKKEVTVTLPPLND